MPDFYYEAFGTRGELKSGQLFAETRQMALASLRTKGLLPSLLRETEIQAGQLSKDKFLRARSRFTLGKKIQYLEMLVPLLRSGMPIVDCHSSMSRNFTDKSLQRLTEFIATSLRTGQSFSVSLSKSDAGFSSSEIARITVAERSSDLLPTILGFVKELKQARAFNQQLISALLYPAILLLASLASVTLVMTFLLPAIVPLFEGREAELPIILKAAISLRDFLAQNALVGLAAILTVASLLWFTTLGSAVKLWLSVRSLHFDVIKTVEAARISKSLGMLLQCGMTLQSAITETVNVATKHPIMTGLKKIAQVVKDGGSFSNALQDLKLFSVSEQQMIGVGLQSNSLAQVLLDIAHDNEERAQRLAQRYVDLLTPVLTLVMGLLVGGLMMSVMQAILSLNRVAL
jgi:general secretion pathway protein F